MTNTPDTTVEKRVREKINQILCEHHGYPGGLEEIIALFSQELSIVEKKKDEEWFARLEQEVTDAVTNSHRQADEEWREKIQGAKQLHTKADGTYVQQGKMMVNQCLDALLSKERKE